MKKIVFASILFINTLPSFSQSENTFNEKRIKYGINFGVNYTNLMSKETLPDNASLSNNVGARLGVLVDYKISKIISFSPKVEVAFNNGKVNFTNSDNAEYKVLPLSLDFKTHFIFKKQNDQLSPYFLFGPTVKIPISQKIDDKTSYSSGIDFALDFGIGIDKAFTAFNFSPELRYSFGLLNVNQNPLLQTLNFHNVSLVLNLLR